MTTLSVRQIELNIMAMRTSKTVNFRDLVADIIEVAERNMAAESLRAILNCLKLTDYKAAARAAYSSFPELADMLKDLQTKLEVAVNDYIKAKRFEVDIAVHEYLSMQ